MKIFIDDSGLAGIAACAFLRRRNLAYDVRLVSGKRTFFNDVLLNQASIDLIISLFGQEIWSRLEYNRITRRIVVDKRGRQHLQLMPALLVSGQKLHRVLRELVPDSRSQFTSAEADFVLVGHSSCAPNPEFLNLRMAGRRTVSIYSVELSEPHEAKSVIFEECETSWLMLIPSGHGRAILQIMHPHARTNIDVDLAAVQSTILIRQCILSLASERSVMPAAPALLPQPFIGGSAAIGTRALKFDPISGEGVGVSLRTGILAALAAVANQDQGDMLGYYRWRSTETFIAHLRACCAIYAGTTWIDERRSMLSLLEDLCVTNQRTDAVSTPASFV